MEVPGWRGQAFVELALVAPVLILLVLGAVTLVQLAQTQVALNTAASATAFVVARGADARDACRAGHQQLSTVIGEAPTLRHGRFQDVLHGRCVGPLPDAGRLPAAPGAGSLAIWFGRSAPGRAFCRVGTATPPGTPSDGDVVVLVAFMPAFDWIPGVGRWLDQRLVGRAVAKIEPFRSRLPAVDPTGDHC
ncbi:MAG TPA: TadE family protein [Candidatus Dormibacteraeota bacterium]|nr:TadE family protein [Candidatus Dormibacteraeota bacterium]